MVGDDRTVEIVVDFIVMRMNEIIPRIAQFAGRADVDDFEVFCLALLWWPPGRLEQSIGEQVQLPGDDQAGQQFLVAARIAPKNRGGRTTVEVIRLEVELRHLLNDMSCTVHPPSCVANYPVQLRPHQETGCRAVGAQRPMAASPLQLRSSAAARVKTLGEAR
jgi:hypothetical protein